jgi:hypothetical protein
MATNAVWLRRVPFRWALPSGLLALVILGRELSRGASLVLALVATVLVLMVALAGSAAWHGIHVGTVPLDRVLLWVMLAGLLARQVVLYGPRPRDWNVMLVTGVVAFVIGIDMARSIPARLHRAIKRLIDRDVLDMTSEGRSAFEERLEQRVRLWAVVGGLVVAAIILVAWLVVMSDRSAQIRWGDLWLVVFECLCGWVAGERLGRMVAYGFFWRPLARDGARLCLVPGHVDGAGGFKPLGDFFFYQSVTASIPAIYLAVWWWLIPLWPSLSGWRQPYLGLLVVAIAFEVLVFVLPMLSIHAAMGEQKAELVSHTDQLSCTISSLQARVREAGSADERQGIKDQIADLTEEYWRVQQTPTWPIDPAIRRRFTVNNLALFLPFLGSAVGGTDMWQQLSEALRNLGA